MRVFAADAGAGGIFAGDAARLTAVAIHPRFREYPLGQADIAVVRLDRAVAGAAAAPLLTGFASVHAVQAGQALTLIGFGRREDDGVGQNSAHKRRVLAATGAELLTAAGADACAGDSGGPAWAEGGMLGVIARGRALGCGGGGYITLVADSACWIAAQAGLAAPAACTTPVPHYSRKELAATRAAALCAHANPTQAETLAHLAIGLNLGSCAETAAALTAAVSLNLDGLALRDLSPLANLPRLETLSMRGDQAHDIAALATLPKLSQVALDGNDIADFSPVAGASVHGQRRQVSTFAATAFRAACRAGEGASAGVRATVRAIQWLTQADDCRQANQRLLALTSLDLAGQNLTDLTPLAGLPTPRRLDLSGNAGLTDVGPLAGLEDLRALDLSGTAVTDLQPLAGLISQGLVITN